MLDDLSSDQIDRILLDAAGLLERDGWRQEADGPTSPDEHGPRCAYGAVCAAVQWACAAVQWAWDAGWGAEETVLRRLAETVGYFGPSPSLIPLSTTTDTSSA